MTFSPLIQRALNIAARQHDGQFRKGIRYPYIVHPVSVAALVTEHTGDETAVIAALLHDVIEDTKGYDYTDMEKDFGPEVPAIVSAVTEDKALPWRKRKEAYLKQLETGPEAALFVCAADKIHNLTSTAEAVATIPADKLDGLEDQLANSGWFYERVTALITSRLPDHPLTCLLKETWNHNRSLFKMNEN